MNAVPSLLAAAILLAGTSAFAQTTPAAEPAASPLTFNLSLTSNYKFRGQDQNQSKTRQFKPALQGGVDYAFDSGFYLGNWNSTINWTKYALLSQDNARVEVDVYGGYKFKAGPIDMDVGALAYLYPSASGANTTEVYVGGGYGPLSAKYSRTVSKGYFGLGKEYLIGEGKGTNYFSLALSQEVAPNTTLKASLGFTDLKSGANNAGLPDYTDYSIGAAYDLGTGFTLTGALVGATKKGSYFYAVDTSRSINRNTLVVTLTKAL
jgi:uncharacterized protein (TIGR02001 family)